MSKRTVPSPASKGNGLLFYYSYYLPVQRTEKPKFRRTETMYVDVYNSLILCLTAVIERSRKLHQLVAGVFPRVRLQARVIIL